MAKKIPKMVASVIALAAIRAKISKKDIFLPSVRTIYCTITIRPQTLGEVNRLASQWCRLC